MTILIDADGCPVVDLTLRIAGKSGVPVVILCFSLMKTGSLSKQIFGSH